MAETDRWTPALRAQFLEILSARRDVRAAAAACGLSRQSVYKLRQRDPEFAHAWEATLPRLPLPAEQQAGAWQKAPAWVEWLGEDGPRGERAREFARLLAAIAGVIGDPVDTRAGNSRPRTPSTPSTVSTAAAHRTQSSPISS